MKRIISRELLQDNVNFEKAKELQTKYSEITSKINSNLKYQIPEENINIITAVDVSYYFKNGKEWGIGCAVFWDQQQHKYIESSYAKIAIKFPYKTGYLGFRESRVISFALKNSKLKPDLLICDGHGIIHPRCFGEAVHLGLALNIPSMGVAKTPYIGYYDYKTLERKKGIRTPIWKRGPYENSIENEIIGYSICLADDRKPVFISIGYKIAIDLAIDIALRLTTNKRQPNALYLAHKLSKEKVKEFFNSEA